jgi:hypothetical protein
MKHYKTPKYEIHLVTEDVITTSPATEIEGDFVVDLNPNWFFK